MLSLLKRLYHSLPIIKELNRIESRQDALLARFRTVDTVGVIQALELLKANYDRYRDPQRLLVHGAQYWSQNFEDGMIAEIFRRIGVTTKTFLEIGVGNGSENNTTALLSAGWGGWWLEGDQRQYDSIAERLKATPEVASRLKVRQAFVSAENISGILSEMQCPDEVDLFSLDIDLNTYHIWAALKAFRPRVVVVEYNAGIPAEQVWIHPYEPEKWWDVTQDMGASLKAYELLGKERGYSLVGCDITGANAFFIRSDLVENKFAAPFTAENHYEPPRYGLTYRMGHPSKFYV
jgi:hypothetical protein